MKKILFIIFTLGQLFIQKSFAQYPVSFPDGIVIGTATTTIPASSPYKLAVSGGIITEKVRVATNGTPFWADFVFEPTYKLRTLGELEKFIQINKHLPEIPSTKEVTQNGIDLAEMQALLLQKVEELSLYVIKQNKKIKILERKVKKFS
jgi:hypothetical protein